MFPGSAAAPKEGGELERQEALQSYQSSIEHYWGASKQEAPEAALAMGL